MLDRYVTFFFNINCDESNAKWILGGKMSLAELIFELRNTVEKCLQHTNEKIVNFIDFKMAFDTL